ncbi:hypothetical protein KGF54_003813 [Candida jiufengensis]|uniref:uncharacterized protein n=1 Tax=Candida jiufengensis TaxID=497108 RepID=UPI002225334C|nr:uncharacterized protein KGF54_003813 [Candida jiufengensis]KAI5950739.1 hypothetical protein KGF54_003813 [Candida jiufengensis]
MLFSKFILSAILSATLIKSEDIDTTVTTTVTITKTLYTPEESASLEAERLASIAAVEAASIASVEAASISSVQAVQSLVDEYYSSLALESKVLAAAKATEAPEQNKNAGYNNSTITAESEYESLTTEELEIDTEVEEDVVFETISELITVSVETSEDGAYVHGVSVAAGLLALVAALL